jgi:hypothetical protein
MANLGGELWPLGVNPFITPVAITPMNGGANRRSSPVGVNFTPLGQIHPRGLKFNPRVDKKTVIWSQSPETFLQRSCPEKLLLEQPVEEGRGAAEVQAPRHGVRPRAARNPFCEPHFRPKSFGHLTFMVTFSAKTYRDIEKKLLYRYYQNNYFSRTIRNKCSLSNKKSYS